LEEGGRMNVALLVIIYLVGFLVEFAIDWYDEDNFDLNLDGKVSLKEALFGILKAVGWPVTLTIRVINRR
jgi:uncharacterized membrane protein